VPVPFTRQRFGGGILLRAGKQRIPRFARNDNLLKFCAGLSSADTGVSPATVLVALSPPTLSQRTRKSGAPLIYVWFGFLRDGPPGEATFVSVGPDLSDVLRNACIDPSLGVARWCGRLHCLRMTTVWARRRAHISHVLICGFVPRGKHRVPRLRSG
jgi:hypothetical protein